MVALPPAAVIEKSVNDALREDLGDGDFMQNDISASLIEESSNVTARLVCREEAVLCGVAWVQQAFHQVDSKIQINWSHADGDALHADTLVCEITGCARAIMSAERTAINFLQTLSGTATTTKKYVDAIATATTITKTATATQILDTRKTIPGMRHAQKYAVVIGGAKNHRRSLAEQMLIKENHIASIGSLATTLARAQAAVSSRDSFFEIEVESIAQLQQALEAGVPRIMLDNFDLPMLRESVKLAQQYAKLQPKQKRAELEFSGNVSLENIRQIAETGVDYISIGALTKHIHAIDFSLRVEGVSPDN